MTIELFSSSIRLKLLVLDLIMGLEDALETTAPQWKDQDKAWAFLIRMRQARLACFSCLPLHKGKVVLSPKQHKQYTRRIGFLRKSISMFWPKGHIDAREFLSVCVILVLAVDKEICNQPRVKATEVVSWNDLIQTLDDLYGAYDPDLAASQQMSRGEQIGEVLLKIINQG